VVNGEYLRYADEKSCEVVDDTTIKIHLTKPFPRFLLDLTYETYGIVSPDYVKNHATPEDPEALKWMADHACGTGPFKLVESVQGQRLVFEKVPDYWRGRPPTGKTIPKVDKVIFQVVGDPSMARLMLEKGEVDIVEKLTADQYEKLKTTPGVQVANYPGAKIVYITYDVTRPPFNDLKVRQAISYAINYDEIIERTERGNVKRLHGLIPSHLPHLGYNPTLGYPYDLAKAQELMKASTHPDGFKTTLVFAPERRPELEQVALYVQAYLKRIGIDVSLQKLAFASQLAKQEKGDYGMSLMVYGGTIRDPDTTVGWLYNMSRGSRGGWNGSFWQDKDVEEKAVKASNMADIAERKAIYQELDRKALNQAIYVYLYEISTVFAMQKNIKNFYYGYNRGYFWQVEKE
jgi:peptide/nickel transport system substrate-binding protein